MNNYYHIVSAGLKDRDATKVSIEYFRRMFNRKTWGRYVSHPPINAMVQSLRYYPEEKECPCCGVTPPPMVQDLIDFVEKHKSPLLAFAKMRNMGDKRMGEALWLYGKLYDYFVKKIGEHPEREVTL